MSGDSQEPIGQDATGGPVIVNLSSPSATASVGSIGLDAIKEPDAPPADAPDKKTAQRRIAEREDSELEHLIRMAKSAPYRSAVVTEREYRRLSEQVRDMSAELLRLHEQIEKEGPQHAIVRQAFHDARGSFSSAALITTVGSVLVSVAGAIGGGTWKQFTLMGGICACAIGCLWTVFTLKWIKPLS